MKQSTEKLIFVLNQSWLSHVELSKSLKQYSQTYINLIHLQDISYTWEEYIAKLSNQTLNKVELYIILHFTNIFRLKLIQNLRIFKKKQKI